MVQTLDAIFKPRSIAIIGASPKPGFPSRVPRLLIKYGFPGEIYPINPKYDELFGYKSYPSLESVPGEVDLALVIIGADRVLLALQDCAAQGVKAAVVFSSGFAETGEEGREKQEKIKELCQRTGLRVLGPNCLGYVALNNKLVVTASSLLDRVTDAETPTNPIAFISQSGALGSMAYAEAMRLSKGFRYYVSTGNEMDVEVSELAAYLVEDPELNVVGLYNESVKDPENLIELGKKAIELGKPVAVLKVGRSSVGKKAAASHTGSLAGSDQVYDAFYKQNGILRAQDLQELLDFLIMASIAPIPKGNRLAIITVSGGAGIMMSDQCETLGIEVPELRPDLQEKLKPFVPPFGSVANPIDVTAELLARPDMVKDTLKVLLQEEFVDAVAIFLGTLDELAPKLIEDVKELKKKTDIPIVFTWFAASEEVLRMITEAKIPVFRDPTRAVGAMKLMMDYRKILDKKEKGILPSRIARKIKNTSTHPDIVRWLKEESSLGKQSLSEYESRKVLEVYSIPVAKAELVNDAREAGKAAEKIGFPVVMKIESPDILHKSDAGCVLLNICSQVQAEEAYLTIVENAKKYHPSAKVNGVIVEEMVSEGTEVIVGIVHDETFGPTVMFGNGGIFVEILKDVSFRVAPFTIEDALEMIQEMQGFKLLQGTRGRRPVNQQKLAELIVNVGNMAYDLKEVIQELDINPLIISEDGESIKAVDALINLK